MTRTVISISTESFENLEMIYPDLSMNERIKKLLDYNNYLQDKVNKLEQEKKLLQKQKIAQRDEYIKQTKINTDKILKYLIKPDLNDNKDDLVVLPEPIKDAVKPIYNTIDDIILDQKLIDNITKAYRDIGGNLVEKKIQDALYLEKEKIFNKSDYDLGLVV